MFQSTLLNRLVALFAATLLCTGCDAVAKTRVAAQKQQMSNNLKQVGIAWHNFNDANAKPATGWADLASAGLPAEVQQALSSYTVAWGTKFTDAAVGTSNFILAYPPDASTAGGQVLLLDGSVKNVTAQEFNDILSAQAAAGPGAAPAGETPPSP